jgi:hypothetical protein
MLRCIRASRMVRCDRWSARRFHWLRRRGRTRKCWRPDHTAKSSLFREAATTCLTVRKDRVSSGAKAHSFWLLNVGAKAPTPEQNLRLLAIRRAALQGSDCWAVENLLIEYRSRGPARFVDWPCCHRIIDSVALSGITDSRPSSCTCIYLCWRCLPRTPLPSASTGTN